MMLLKKVLVTIQRNELREKYAKAMKVKKITIHHIIVLLYRVTTIKATVAIHVLRSVAVLREIQGFPAEAHAVEVHVVEAVVDKEKKQK